MSRTIQTAGHVRAGASATESAPKTRRRAARVKDTAREEDSSRDRVRRPRSSQGTAGLGERLIAGVPARIMRPRLVFLACLVALVLFGLLMVYSASSVTAMQDTGDAAYYLKRQIVFALVGAALIAVLAWKAFPWDILRGKPVWAFFCLVVFMLLVVLFFGTSSRGATRWIDLGFFTLQPSEFAKPMLVLVCAKLCQDYYEDRTIRTGEFLRNLFIAIGVMLPLILVQPDLGTTLIICVTLFAMLYLAGISKKLVVGIVAAIVLLGAIALFSTPYRVERLKVAMDPWSDPYGDGFQATLAIMAFASGGLFGRGIGNSTMKYNYLPEAHNDFILAIIGEEVGFVGTLIFFAVFIALIWSAFRIARQATSLFDRLVAEGSAICLMVQFLVNALGILAVIPMTGKPLPFISAGGSTMIASMIFAGLILRVSVNSGAQTVYAARREGFAVMSEEDAYSAATGRSTAGTVRVRRGTAAAPYAEDAPHGSRHVGFSVLEGSAAAPTRRVGAEGDAASTGRSRGADARSRYARGASSPIASGRERGDAAYGRVDLGGGAASRLRGDDGPRVRTRNGASGGFDRGYDGSMGTRRNNAAPRSRSSARNDRPNRGRNGRGRGRYDR